MSRPFRFAASAHQAASADEWRELARRVEGQGFETLVVSDHLGAQLSPMPALAVAAEATSTLRVGTLVSCNDFRHPVVHAKEIATLDLLSGGRFEWGIGAGWLASEYAAAGMPFDPAGTRVDRMQESITLMKRYFTEETVEFSGRHYRTSGLAAEPKPLQRPHPPLLVGGAEPRVLAIAAREADIVGIAPSPRGRRIGDRPPLETVEAAIDRQLDDLRVAAGDRYLQLELNMVAFPVIVTNDRTERAERVAANLGLEPEQVLASPHAWIGSVEQITAALLEYRERWGVSYWAIPAATSAVVAPIVAQLAGT